MSSTYKHTLSDIAEGIFAGHIIVGHAEEYIKVVETDMQNVSHAIKKCILKYSGMKREKNVLILFQISEILDRIVGMCRPVVFFLNLFTFATVSYC